jgi:hypothetical protein
MLRTTAIASIVLLISTAAMAQVPTNFVGAYQTQNLVGAITNSVQLGLDGFGQNIVSLKINNNQTLDNVQHMIANQGQDTFLMQVGKAFADGGIVAITQELSTVGSQGQAIGSGIAPKQQTQGLGLVGAQANAKPDGQGGENGFVFFW